MLRRSISCGVLAGSFVLPCAVYAQEYRTLAKFWTNGSDVAAYQDMVCGSKRGLPPTQYPIPDRLSTASPQFACNPRT